MSTDLAKKLCCEDAKRYIEYKEADDFFGPDKTGWAMDVRGRSSVDINYVNVYSCPFCEVKLPKGDIGNQ